MPVAYSKNVAVRLVGASISNRLRPDHELEPKAAGMKESVYLVTETGLKSWQEAILEYKSQLPVLGGSFNTVEKAWESIQSYWAERRGIPLWKVT